MASERSRRPVRPGVIGSTAQSFKVTLNAWGYDDMGNGIIAGDTDPVVPVPAAVWMALPVFVSMGVVKSRRSVR